MVWRRAGPGLSGSAVGGRHAHDRRYRGRRRTSGGEPRHRPHLAAARDAAFRRARGRPVDDCALRAEDDRPRGAAVHAARARSTHALAQRGGRHEGAGRWPSAVAAASVRTAGARGHCVQGPRPAHSVEVRARRPDLFRRARRQAAHLRTDGRMAPADESARPRRGARGARAPLFHEPRPGHGERLRLVVRPVGRRRAIGAGDGASEPAERAH